MVWLQVLPEQAIEPSWRWRFWHAIRANALAGLEEILNISPSRAGVYIVCYARSPAKRIPRIRDIATVRQEVSDCVDGGVVIMLLLATNHTTVLYKWGTRSWPPS